MEKTFGGDLGRVDVPDLLAFVQMGRRTGVLLLEREEQQTSLYFRDGELVFGSSNKDGLRLSDVLVRVGKLGAEHVQKIVESHRATGHRIGQILVAQKLLTEEELVSHLKIQTSEVVFDTFRWRLGSFGFYDDVIPPTHAVVLEMDLQNLIMEGVRRIAEEGRLAKVFPDLHWIAEPVGNPDHVKKSVTLTPQEWRLYFLLDGRRSLSEVCQIAGDPDDLATLEILRRLAEANLVVVAPPPLRPPAPQPGFDGTIDPGGDQASADAGFSIELAAAKPAPRSEDDSRKIVSPLAVDFAGPSPKPLVARLVLDRHGSEVSFPITRESCAVGRHASNDIVIENGRVSAFHARIDRTHDGYVLVDLRSTNGTFLNSRQVAMGVLASGDEIRLGPARLRFRLEEASAVARPPAPAGRRS